MNKVVIKAFSTHHPDPRKQDVSGLDLTKLERDVEEAKAAESELVAEDKSKLRQGMETFNRAWARETKARAARRDAERLHLYKVKIQYQKKQIIFHVRARSMKRAIKAGNLRAVRYLDSYTKDLARDEEGSIRTTRKPDPSPFQMIIEEVITC